MDSFALQKKSKKTPNTLKVIRVIINGHQHQFEALKATSFIGGLKYRHHLGITAFSIISKSFFPFHGLESQVM